MRPNCSRRPWARNGCRTAPDGSRKGVSPARLDDQGLPWASGQWAGRGKGMLAGHCTLHRHSRKMADTVHTVVVEDLNTKDMTGSAKGTTAEPGTNFKQKAGLNRGILKSNRGRMERMLDYKAGGMVRVGPADTSRTCAECGHEDPANRRTQSHFHCTACGHTANAGQQCRPQHPGAGPGPAPEARGTGASARRDAFGPWPLPVATDKSTSATREQGMPSLPRGSTPWYTGI